MFLDFDDLDGRSRYKLLTATVVPRPIALVSTMSAKGVVNAAPFSFFNIFSEDPALAILGLEARRENNGLKDTTRNIIDTGELVINLVDQKIGSAMAACAMDLPKHTSELPLAGLTEAPSRRVAPPGVQEAPIRLECRLFEMRKITPARHLCIAEILALHSREGLIDPKNMHVDASAYTPIGRLHGEQYVAVQDSFRILIPDLPQSIAGTPKFTQEETGS